MAFIALDLWAGIRAIWQMNAVRLTPHGGRGSGQTPGRLGGWGFNICLCQHLLLPVNKGMSGAVPVQIPDTGHRVTSRHIVWGGETQRALC